MEEKQARAAFPGNQLKYTCPHIYVYIHGQKCDALLDSGASKCFIPVALAEKLELEYERRKHGFIAINHSTFTSLGTVDLHFRFGLSKYNAMFRFFIAPVPYIILGSDMLSQGQFSINYFSQALISSTGDVVTPFMALRPKPEEEIAPLRDEAIVRVSGDGRMYALTSKSFPNLRMITQRNPTTQGTSDVRFQGQTIRPVTPVVPRDATPKPVQFPFRPPPSVDGKVTVLPRPTNTMPQVTKCLANNASHSFANNISESSSSYPQTIAEDSSFHSELHLLDSAVLTNKSANNIGDESYFSITRNVPIVLNDPAIMYVSPGQGPRPSGSSGEALCGLNTRSVYCYGDTTIMPQAACGEVLPVVKTDGGESPAGGLGHGGLGPQVERPNQEVTTVSSDISQCLPVEAADDFVHTPIVTDHDFAFELVELVAANMELCGEVVHHQLPIPQSFENLCAKHSSLFSEELGLPPTHDIKHRIILLEQPKKTRMYSIPLKYQEAVEHKLHEMIDAGILRPSSSHIASPMTIQLKKNGQVRPCIDYRALNEVIQGDLYPLPRIDELVARIHGNVFSSIDLKDGFHQVPLEPDSIPLTAVFTPFGNFEFTRLPFGLKTAPSGFQRFIDIVLHGIRNVVAYIDDILVFSNSVGEHLQTLHQIFEAMAQYGLRINRQKSHFFQSQVTFLGFDFNRDGHRPTEQCLPKIEGLTPPRTRRQLQSFLGVIGYYRAHIPNFAKIADPLYQLLPVKSKFHWDGAQQQAFETLRDLLTKRYPLAQPTDSEIFHLYVDASQEGMGAVLIQRAGIVGYYAKRFNPTQRRYAVCEQEALALVTALRHYRYLLLGQRTIVWTDHKPLVTWYRKPMMRDLPLRQAKWLVAIQDIEVDIRYIPGEHNHFADLLSRPDGNAHFTAHERVVQFEFPPPPVPRQKVLPAVGEYEAIIEHQVGTTQSCFKTSCSVPVDPDDKYIFYNIMSEIEALEVSPLLNSLSYPRSQEQTESIQALLAAQAHEEVFHWNMGPNLPIEQIDGVYGVRSGSRFRVLIPTAYRLPLIRAHHNNAHQGGRLTCQALSQYYFWPRMRHDIDSFVSSCAGCARAKPDRPRPRAPLSFLATDRFKCVHVDIVGNLRPSKRGNTYIVTIMDRSTRWLEAIPTRSISAITVTAIFIKHWIARFGLPELIISDQGRQFESDLFQRVLQYFGITRRRGTPYHPQTNGRLERAHRTMKSLLRALQVKFADWEEALPYALFAMRTAVSDRGYSPAQLVYVEPLVVPTALVVPPVHARFLDTPHLYLRNLQSDLVTIRSMLTEELQNIDPQSYPYKAVFLKSLDPGALEARYQGPYKVISVNFPTVVIEVDGKPQRVNVDRLKPASCVPLTDEQPEPDEGQEIPLLDLPQAAPPLLNQPVVDISTESDSDEIEEMPQRPGTPLFSDQGISSKNSQDISALPSPNRILPQPRYFNFDQEEQFYRPDLQFEFDNPHVILDGPQQDNQNDYRLRHPLRASIAPPTRYGYEMPRASMPANFGALIPPPRESLMARPDYLFDQANYLPDIPRSQSPEVEAILEIPSWDNASLLSESEPRAPIPKIRSIKNVISSRNLSELSSLNVLSSSTSIESSERATGPLVAVSEVCVQTVVRPCKLRKRKLD